MFSLSPQYNLLLDHYSHMAENGYHRTDGQFVKNVYSDAEPLKFSQSIKKIVEYFKAETALDYGSGGSNLNTVELQQDIKFIDFVGLKKIYPFEPARKKGKLKKCDLVLCFDVLEHIFINDVPWVLKELFANAKQCVIINVACYKAAALLPNGENAHITVRPPLWWLGQIECISTLYPEIYWALFTSQGYQNFDFLGLHRMKDKIDSKKFVQ